VSFKLENDETNASKSFDFKLKPKNFDDPSIYEKSAIEKTGYTMDVVAGFPPEDEAFEKIRSVFNRVVDVSKFGDKMFFVGFNSRFDYDFLRAWFEEKKDNFWYFFYPDVDMMRVVAFLFMDSRSKFKKFTLEGVAEAIGIKVESEKLHDSMYDVELVQEIYHKIVG